MRTARLPLACAIGLLGAGCSGIQSALDPAGPGAARIGDLWWLMLYVCAAVFALVMAMLAWALLRRRDGEGATALDQRRERRMGYVVGTGVGLTAVILFIFLVASFQVGRDLAAQAPEPTLAIDVTAQRWWWDVRYHDPQPSRRFRTANEIHIPVGQPVELRLTTGLPELGASFFTAASMMIAIPSGIQIFCWIATLWGGRPQYTTALLFVLGFFFIFVLGGFRA